jgi:hypothetical protein
MDKDLAKIIRALEAQGFTWTITKSQHIVVRKDDVFVTALGGNRKDWRGYRNAIAEARRFGFQWPPR